MEARAAIVIILYSSLLLINANGFENQRNINYIE